MWQAFREHSDTGDLQGASALASCPDAVQSQAGTRGHPSFQHGYLGL